ncbi:hypothetical protein EN978_34120 [Mesorhizobium sp. M7A.F.Ca.US.001.04.1.1]|uniref:hypothetical protein n=1 Tax=unclassified Mesorhizobium TaxID=325217 RepID=UPI000FCC2C8B|nr:MULTISPECIES: hypothetical protein [unclassified Mesorhizobium]RUY22840.1 hypothetical protein EN979_30815 [Mesorhizobium sp. M7A.F.Ca.US.001.04.2.1]RUY34722.1 hypothetical protein EN978_34120 [Mesorhizobium sp. M7A.F.Ca.US.001.04.1.1]
MTDSMTLHDATEGEDHGGAGANRLPIRFEARDLFVELGQGQLIEHVLAIVATNHGLLIEDLYVVPDGEDEPMDCAHPVRHDGRHRRYHVHHRHPVDVTVRYQASVHHREFRRHAPLERVLDWAIVAFGIDPAMAGEFELARAGSAEELPLSEHVGHLAGKHDRLELDLVRGDIANGGIYA